jgi:hypothetical protein
MSIIEDRKRHGREWEPPDWRAPVTLKQDHADLRLSVHYPVTIGGQLSVCDRRHTQGLLRKALVGKSVSAYRVEI